MSHIQHCWCEIRCVTLLGAFSRLLGFVDRFHKCYRLAEAVHEERPTRSLSRSFLLCTSLEAEQSCAEHMLEGWRVLNGSMMQSLGLAAWHDADPNLPPRADLG